MPSRMKRSTSSRVSAAALQPGRSGTGAAKLPGLDDEIAAGHLHPARRPVLVRVPSWRWMLALPAASSPSTAAPFPMALNREATAAPPGRNRPVRC